MDIPVPIDDITGSCAQLCSAPGLWSPVKTSHRCYGTRPGQMSSEAPGAAPDSEAPKFRGLGQRSLYDAFAIVLVIDASSLRACN